MTHGGKSQLQSGPGRIALPRPCRLGMALLASWLAAAGAAAGAQESAPQLRVETGTHTSSIQRLAVSADQRLLAKASDDKTVRNWRLEDAALLQVLRPPIGPAPEGRQYGTAFHPRQELIAVGATGVRQAPVVIAAPPGLSDYTLAVISTNHTWLKPLGVARTLAP